MVHVEEIRERGNVVLEFSGALDARGAEELACLALQQSFAPHLVIDLSRASTILDAALWQLVDSLPEPRARTIRGGSPAQRQLLQRLGERVDGDPDEGELAHTD